MTAKVAVVSTTGAAEATIGEGVARMAVRGTDGGTAGFVPPVLPCNETKGEALPDTGREATVGDAGVDDFDADCVPTAFVLGETVAAAGEGVKTVGGD